MVADSLIKAAAVGGVAAMWTYTTIKIGRIWAYFTYETLKICEKIALMRLAYETAQARYAHERTKLLDWIETNRENKELAKQNFTNTDYAFKLYNQAHPEQKMTLPKEPKFSDFYQPSEAQKQGELIFVGGSALALGYAAFRFL